MSVSISALTASAWRRLAKRDFAGFLQAARKEVRIPTSSIGRVLNRINRVVAKIRGGWISLGVGHQSSKRTLFLFYDLEVAPITFDFGWSLASADMRRRSLGLDFVRVVIVPGPHNGGRREPADYDGLIDSEARKWRVWNVLVSMCQSLPALDGVVVCQTRNQASEIYFTEAIHIFPEHYTPDSPIVTVNETVYSSEKSQTKDIAVLRAPTEAKRYVEKWVGQFCPGRKLVTITLRESDYMPARNSNIAEWKEFCARLNPEKYHVALIPDTDKSPEFEPSGWKNATVVKEASLNLQIRHAFYESAYASLAVDSGPLILALLNRDAVFAIFIKVREDVPQAASEYLKKRGFAPGDTPFFCTPFQKWVWDEDRADLIENAFRSLEVEIEHGRAGVPVGDRTHLNVQRLN